MRYMRTRTKVLIGTVVLLLAAGATTYLLTRGPTAEERAAAAEAAAAAAARAAGESCEALTEEAFDVLRQTDAALNGAGYTLDDYGDQIAEVNYEVSSISYYDDPLCEDAVGEHLEDAARYYSDAEDDWFTQQLQVDWSLAATALSDAENGLRSVYDGKVAPDSTTTTDDEEPPATPDDSDGSVSY